MALIAPLASSVDVRESRSRIQVKENAFLWLLTGGGALALIFALGAGREPEGFFVAVRVVVCLASAYAAVAAYRAKREVWTWLLGANAALYNPFVLVRLTRDIWELVDLADIALLVAAAIVVRVRGERVPDPGQPSGTPPQAPTAPNPPNLSLTPCRQLRDAA